MATDSVEQSGLDADLRLPLTRRRAVLAIASVVILTMLILMLFGVLSWIAALVLGLVTALTAAALSYEGWSIVQKQPEAMSEKDPPPLSGATAEAALERLPDPVILLDETGRVVLANEAAHQAVGGPSLRRHVSSVMRTPVVLEAVTRVLGGGPPEKVEYSFLVPFERHYQAHICPVPVETGVWALVILHDLTTLKRVDQMRADFVANASHELRTPLASVSGFIDTLRGHARNDPEAQEKFLEIMHDQATRMRRLIDDLLSLSRIELNEHVYPSGSVDLVGVLRDVVDALAPIAARQNGKIVLVAPDQIAPIPGDRDELFQVFQNLVDNAIKYGADGGEITVTCGLSTVAGRRPGAVFVAVRDRGEGIAREHVPRLTERFYRVDAKRSRERGGTGLGLAIVKHILVRHRGWLSIDSKPGEGSTFTVFLPGSSAGAEDPIPQTAAAQP
jgi:two-component system phosphate regulon sensor histidine kinase PhoR